MFAFILSLAGLGGGLGLLTWLIGPAAMLDFGRSILGFLAKIPWQVYAIGALAAVMAFLIISRSHALARADKAEARIELVCKAVRDVAGRPRQDCRLNELQIHAFGRAIAGLEGAIQRQNAAVNALALKTVQQQNVAAKAIQMAASRAEAAQAAAQRLDHSSRSAPLKSAPAGVCEPSSTLKGQWS